MRHLFTNNRSTSTISAVYVDCYIIEYSLFPIFFSLHFNRNYKLILIYFINYKIVQDVQFDRHLTLCVYITVIICMYTSMIRKLN